jgi:hypothetical protein
MKHLYVAVAAAAAAAAAAAVVVAAVVAAAAAAAAADFLLSHRCGLKYSISTGRSEPYVKQYFIISRAEYSQSL